jgi:hypothetical protein
MEESLRRAHAAPGPLPFKATSADFESAVCVKAISIASRSLSIQGIGDPRSNFTTYFQNAVY